MIHILDETSSGFLIVNKMVNKDEKTKTYCIICSFDNMLVIAQKFW